MTNATDLKGLTDAQCWKLYSALDAVTPMYEYPLRKDVTRVVNQWLADNVHDSGDAPSMHNLINIDAIEETK